jgi:hypothetical protein
MMIDNENWQGKPKYSETTCSNATLTTTSPTCLDLGSNPGHRDGKPATNRLNHGTDELNCYYYITAKLTVKVLLAIAIMFGSIHFK